MLNIHPDSALMLVTEYQNERVAIAEQGRRTASARAETRSSVRRAAGGALIRIGSRLTETP